jgi:iron complex outermembrane receptor protein
MNGIRIKRQILLSVLLGWSVFASAQQSPVDLFSMSLEDLLQVEVSSSSKYKQALNQAHSNVLVISRDEILNRGFETLSEALNYVNGFYMTNDRNYTYVGIRGFSRPSDYNDRILVMIDGHVMNENVYGSAPFGYDLGLDLSLVDRIEVMKGPGAALYGNGAMMSVVNIITKSEEVEDKSVVQTGFGSHGLVKANFVIEKESENHSFYTGISARSTRGEDLYFRELDSPSNHSGIAENLDEEKSYGFYGRYQFGNFELKAMGAYRDKGIPTGVWDTSLDRQSNTVDKQAFVDFLYRKSGKGHSFSLNGGFDFYHYFGNYAHYEELVSDESIGKKFSLQAEYLKNLKNAGNLIFGTEWHYSPTSDYQEGDEQVSYFYYNNHFFNASAYLQYEVALSPEINFLSGIRADYYDYTSLSLNPRISLIYTPEPNWNFRISFNKAFRAPNTYELYYESVDNNASNPDLKPENVYYFDFDVKKQFTRSFYTGLSLYYYRMADMIDSFENEEGLTQFGNLGYGSGKGGSIYSGLLLGSNLNLKVSYDFIRFRVENEDGILEKTVNSPDQLFKFHLLYRVPEVVYLGLNTYFESGRKTIDMDKTKSFWVTDLQLNSAKFLRKFQIGLKIKNLFNQDYYVPAGYEHAMDQMIQPKRSFQMSLHCDL